MAKKQTLKHFLAIAISVLLVLCVSFVCFLHRDALYIWGEYKGIHCQRIPLDEVSAPDGRILSEDELCEQECFCQNLMLINTSYMLPDDFSAMTAEYKNVTMNKCAVDAYIALADAVYEINSKKLYISSHFRSSEKQAELYKELPDTATVPGASEHQTGLALDVYVPGFSGDSFCKCKEGRFVDSLCWQYGFIVRYPVFGEKKTGIRFEPWHLRFVGHPHSDIIYNAHTTLEEYIFSLTPDTWYSACGYTFARLTPSESMYIPYSAVSISPDNTGYYIVTAK